MTIFNGHYLVQIRVVIWSKFGVQKMPNLDQIITITSVARSFFQKQSAETPIL